MWLLLSGCKERWMQSARLPLINRSSSSSSVDAFGFIILPHHIKWRNGIVVCHWRIKSQRKWNCHGTPIAAINLGLGGVLYFRTDRQAGHLLLLLLCNLDKFISSTLIDECNIDFDLFLKVVGQFYLEGRAGRMAHVEINSYIRKSEIVEEKFSGDEKN